MSLEVGKLEVGRVMRDDMKMRYKNITAITWKQNSDTNRVLRQVWSKAFIRMQPSTRVILNFDESWIDHMDCRYRKWGLIGSPNSISKKQVHPRVTMIMAIDTLGNLYSSYTQVNTDSLVISMYLRELVKQLDKDRPKWRDNTVVLLDNAKWHTAGLVLDTMSELRVPVMFLPPHAYKVAPIEMLFAAIKAKDLNPAHHKTGKW